MKKIMAVTMMFLLLAGVVYAAGNTLTQKSGDLTVTAQFQQAGPVVGENVITFTIKDGAGKNVTDAAVSVRYFMTEKASATRKGTEMPAMHSSADATLDGSAYTAKINISMPGPWHIVVKTIRGGETSSAAFYITVK